jgi:hypothetical protein
MARFPHQNRRQPRIRPSIGPSWPDSPALEMTAKQLEAGLAASTIAVATVSDSAICPLGAAERAFWCPPNGGRFRLLEDLSSVRSRRRLRKRPRPMKPTAVIAIAVVAIAPAGCSCAASHTLDGGVMDADAASAADAAEDVDGRDASADGSDALACNPFGPYFGALECTPEIEEACIEWAQGAWGGAGYIYTTCFDSGGVNAGCAIGDWCPEPGPDADHPPPCQCTRTLTCPGGYLCVSDTLDGPRRCEPACIN